MTEQPESPPRSRLLLLTGLAGAVVVLAAAGATGGWLLAGSKENNQAAPSSPSPTRSPTATPRSGEFALPNLIGTDFVAARRVLRDSNLGVQVIFGGTGYDRTVEQMVPTPGTAVHAGITVKLHIAGAPPELTVPRLVGMGCAAAGREAAEQGLNPRYVPEKEGTVVRQEPEPSTAARWTDTITLSCAYS